MSQLGIIIKQEYLMEVQSKNFWIGTIVVPLVMVLFGVFMGFLMADSSSFMTASQELGSGMSPDPEQITGPKLLGMILGLVLTFILMMYGAMIFNKVKTEKCNRIMEIICTCVDGKTMMLAKIISVGLIGLAQLMVWGCIFIAVGICASIIFQSAIPWEWLSDWRVWNAAISALLYFIGGYIFFGSLYAACGAITDKDNENQIYMTVITFILLGSFYIGEYAVDNSDSALSITCMFIPFFSPTVGTVNAASGATPLWINILSVLELYVCAFVCVAFAGKLYRASLLMKGKQFSPRDIITFIKIS